MNFIYENIDTKNILKKYYTTKIEGTEVKLINDKTHPVYNNYGLFSTKEWSPFDIIGEYTGEIIDYYKHSEYLVSFQNISISICVDGENNGNECRYINHYQNIKEKPNCKYVSTFINLKPVILIVVIDFIKKGEEIVADYCYNF